MVVVLRPNPPKEKTEMLINEIKSQYPGVSCHCTEGTQVTIVGLVGDTSHVDMDSILAHQDIVELAYKSRTKRSTGNSIRRIRSLHWITACRLAEIR